MSGFNNDEYLLGQIKKQVEKEVKTKCKLKLDFSPFTSELENITEERLLELDNLICEKNICEINDLIKEKKLSYNELTLYYIKTIENKESKMNSIIELNPKALELAKKCSYDKNNHEIYGMPILIKGNIAAHNLHTSAGSEALKDFICKEDADVIKQLKMKGAIILGTCNLSEFANFMSSNSSNGYSALGGQTKNAYGNYDVGGSSSGSACSTSSNFCIASLGTETAGSIIYPSSQNGVVGLKPTLGLLSINNIIPISKTHDTAGPITKCVKDAGTLLSSMLKVSEEINYEKNMLKGKKIALVVNDEVEGFYRKEDKTILSRITEELKVIGAIVDNTKLDEEVFKIDIYGILKHEFNSGIKEFLETSKHDFRHKTLFDIHEFNKSDLNNFVPYNQEIITDSINYKSDEIEEEINSNKIISRAALDKAFEEYDLLFTLSNYLTTAYASAGYPAITVPAGYRENGEPVGVTLITKEYEDFKLIEYAYSYEQNTLHRKKP